MIVLSLALASTIAGPVRRLADSAERVRRRIRTRVEIPDFTGRRDEIGHLSGALRDMTVALYNRIEAIEMFAADVAHELKNPLTSLRSAVETLPLARTENSRSRLLAVIEHDVKRLDRLISDISDASRLDAELQRQDMAPVDLRRLLTALASVANETRRGNDIGVELRFEGRGRRHLLGAGPRFAAWPSGLQSAVECPVVLRNRQQGADRMPPRALRTSKSSSTTMGPAFATTRSPGSSSASTPTGRIRALARIPGWAFRSPSKSSRPMAARSGLRTASGRRTPASHGGRRPLCGPAARSMTRRQRAGSIHASAVRVGDRAVLIRGPSGSGKSRLAFDLLLAGRAGQYRPRHAGRRRPRPCRAAEGQLVVRPARALAGLIEVRGLGIRRCDFASEARSAWSWTSVRPTPSACRRRKPFKPDRGYFDTKNPVQHGFSGLPLVIAALTMTANSSSCGLLEGIW